MRVAISQNNYRFLSSLRDILNAGTLVRDINKRKRPNWSIKFNGIKDIRKFLEYVEPYTVLRRKEVQIALQICEITPTKSGPGKREFLEERARLEGLLRDAAEERRTRYLELDMLRLELVVHDELWPMITLTVSRESFASGRVTVQEKVQYDLAHGKAENMVANQLRPLIQEMVQRHKR